jgi:hypothetical protein
MPLATKVAIREFWVERENSDPEDGSVSSYLVLALADGTTERFYIGTTVSA